MGLVAVLLWSTNIACSRSLTEQLGPRTAGACMLLLAGVLGCLYAGLVQRRLRVMLRLPRAYLAGCGGLFVAYMICIYLAIGLAANRQQVLEVGLINYLWPGLTLALAVPLTGTRVRPLFWLGVALALAGAVLAPLKPEEYSLAVLTENLRSHLLPYVFALGAAVTWALYSPLSRRWAGNAEGGAVPLFVLASGAALAMLRLVWPDETVWTPRAAAELVFLAIFPTLLAYVFWDAAMRRGNLTVVTIFSYATPLLSTVVSALYLRVSVGLNLWIACGLIVAGAVISWMLVEREPRAESEPRL